MTDETKTRPATTDGQPAQPALAQPPVAQPAQPAVAQPAQPPVAQPAVAQPVLAPPSARLQIWEIVAVFAVSLGASGLYALVNLIGSLTAKQSLSKQTAVLNGSMAPGRPLLDLTLQLLNITLSLAPVLLVFYLLARAGEGPSSIGVDASQPGRDLGRGTALAAIVGGTGLGLYLIAYHIGVELNVVAENLPDIWWRIPVLLLSAFQNAVLEEVVVLGYLMSRLDRLGVRPRWAIVISAVVRGSYHLYQGVGGFIGNAVMGALFGVLFRRWGRVTPMIIAHFLIDSVAFVGYAVLAGHVSWLPRP
jgi:membrane protease YdiL (CAAX protease family)